MFAVTALIIVALAARAKMQKQDVVWDRDVFLSAAQKCLNGDL